VYGSRAEQDSFGAEMNGSWGDSSVTKHNWGSEYDSDVALYYFGGKRSWFSPERGMYLQHGSAYTLPVPPILFDPNVTTPLASCPLLEKSVDGSSNFAGIEPVLRDVYVYPVPSFNEDPYQCAMRIYNKAEKTRGHNDHWRHCVVSCQISRECILGFILSGACGIADEIRDAFRELDPGEFSLGDLWADAYGALAASMSGFSCEDACESEFPGKKRDCYF